ncbi:10510_t:CDS:2, partial [Ambispora gerdemannii]
VICEAIENFSQKVLIRLFEDGTFPEVKSSFPGVTAQLSNITVKEFAPADLQGKVSCCRIREEEKS